jgi:hypothetical protein
MSLILGANSVSGGYEVDNSLRYNSASSDSLSRTFASNGNRQKFTFSYWVKRGTLSVAQEMYFVNVGGGTFSQFSFAANNTITFASVTSSVTDIDLASAAVFRDPSAWYHIVLAVDTTQATSTNRVFLYVNGVSQTITGTFPALNYNCQLNNTTIQYIGRPSTGTFGGYFSEYYFIDGQQLTPSSFGETDTLSEIWIPIPYTGTFGTNGYYLEFKDSSALGDDTSGNGNDWTVNNLTSVDQSTDTPTNNFATLNPLHSSTSTLSDGNLTVVANTDFVGTFATIGVNKGKWYFEAKINSSGSPQDAFIGVSGDNASTSSSPQSNNPSVLYGGDGSIYKDGSSAQSGLTGFSANNIIGVALNMDDLEIEFYNNGVKQGSTQSMSAYSGFYLPFYIGANNRTSSWNFGNPPFTISSGNADANGFGNFEYAVPAGYYALCTENLAQYG